VKLIPSDSPWEKLSAISYQLPADPFSTKIGERQLMSIHQKKIKRSHRFSEKKSSVAKNICAAKTSSLHHNTLRALT
jgi:hypothetical protein